jgi:hypothetical protein
MGNFRKVLLDILAFPVKLYEKLTDRKSTLIAGIVLVGAIDLLLPDVKFIIKELFLGKSVPDTVYNAGMAVLVLLLMGFIDVICIGVPLFDIFRYLKRKESQLVANTGIGVKEQQPALQPSAIKVMKIYIMSHFIITPVSVVFNYWHMNSVGEDGPALLQNLAMMFFMLINIWAAAVMARGINALYRFNILFRKLTFIIVFIWNFLFGMVFSIMISDWLIQLFR